jgi:hypothetical protein
MLLDYSRYVDLSMPVDPDESYERISAIAWAVFFFAVAETWTSAEAFLGIGCWIRVEYF